MLREHGHNGPLTPAGYLPRVTDASVGEALAIIPIVVVEGARGVGKHGRACDTPAARSASTAIPARRRRRRSRREGR